MGMWREFEDPRVFAGETNLRCSLRLRCDPIGLTRPLRMRLAGAIHHVVSRGGAGQSPFEDGRKSKRPGRFFVRR